MTEKTETNKEELTKQFKNNILRGSYNKNHIENFLPLVVCSERRSSHSIIGYACQEPNRTHNQQIYSILHKHSYTEDEIIDAFNIAYGLCIIFVHVQEPHNIYKMLRLKVETHLKDKYTNIHVVKDQVEDIDEDLRRCYMINYITTMQMAIFGVVYYLLYIQKEKSFELRQMLEEISDYERGICFHLCYGQDYKLLTEELESHDNTFYQIVKKAHEVGETECMSFDIWRRDLAEITSGDLEYMTNSFNTDIVQMLLMMPVGKIAKQKLADRIIGCIRSEFVNLYMSEPEYFFLRQHNHDVLRYLVDKYGDGNIGSCHLLKEENSLTEEDHLVLLSQKLHLPSYIMECIEGNYYEPILWGLPGLRKHEDDNPELDNEDNKTNVTSDGSNLNEQSNYASIDDVRNLLKPKMSVMSQGKIVEFDYDKDKLIDNIKPEACGWATDYHKAAIGLAAFNSAGLLPNRPNMKFVRCIIRHSVALDDCKIKSIAAMIGRCYKKLGAFTPSNHAAENLSEDQHKYFDKIYKDLILKTLKR